jgi:tetratricopeptide (TPR) repeat protein
MSEPKAPHRANADLATAPTLSPGDSSLDAPQHADDVTLPPLDDATLPPEDATPPLDEEQSSQERLTPESPGRYELRDVLGAGGIGKVSLVFDKHLERAIALKELKTPASGVSMGKGARLRFLKEARITGSLEHPNIVPVYELGRRRDGSVYYSMKRVRGRSLAQALTGRSFEQRMQLLPHLIDVCQAVAYAHDRGVIHRDLKPDNVMLGAFGETVVLDWGLAKVRGEADAPNRELAAELDAIKDEQGMHTIAGVPLGTPSHMPPEQARGDLEAIDERSDVYSLGVMLFELITGRVPFAAPSVGALLQAVQHEPTPLASDLEKACPPELADIAARALTKDPAERYPDAKALVADLQAFQTGGLVGAHRYSLAELTRRQIIRHRKAIAAIVIVLGAVAGAWWYRGHEEEKARALAERKRLATVMAKVERLLSKTARGSRQKRWLEIYTYRLISLREPAVERRLVRALDHASRDVRRLAALSLAGMGSRAAVSALTKRLAPGVESEEKVVIEVINALGVIGDAAANEAVRKARWRYGQFSHVWKNTELAFRMIPMPPIPAGKRLSANEYTDRGRAWENKGDRQQAIAAYDNAIALDPKLARAYNNRANAKKQGRDYAGARSDYLTALELDPKNLASLYNLAQLEKRMGNTAKARAGLTRVIEMARGRVRVIALRARGGLHLEQGDFGAAGKDLERAVKLDPRSAFGHRLLGRLHWQQGDIERALDAHNRALALSPGYTIAYVTRSRLQWLKGDPPAARSDVDRAIELEPSHLWARWQRAYYLAFAGKHAEAKKDLDACISSKTNRSEAYLRRAVLLATSRNIKKTLADWKRSLRLAKGRRGKARVSLLMAASRRIDGLDYGRALVAAREAAIASRRPFWRAVGRLLASKAAKDASSAFAAGTAPHRRCLAAIARGLVLDEQGNKAEALRAYAALRPLAPATPECVLLARLAEKRNAARALTK